MKSSNSDPWVVVGRIRAPHGLRGEVAVEVLTDSPQRFSPGHVLHLRRPGAPPTPVRLESSRPHKQALLVKLERVDTRDEAERLRHLELVIPEEEAKDLPAGRHYPFRLVGCRVLSRDSGAELGDVTGVLETPGGSLLEVQGPKGEVLIPLVEGIVLELDEGARRIVVALPQGLADLNR